MDPKRLLIFRSVARAGSISAAARELGWTQPWFLVSAIGREGTWPIMLEVQSFFDRLREDAAEQAAEVLAVKGQTFGQHGSDVV